MPQKLLVLLPYLTPSIGGGAFVLANLLDPLREEGFELEVVYFQERARGLIPVNIKGHWLAKEVGKAGFYLQYPRLVFRLSSILQEFEPDAILCNSYQPYFLALLARKLSGVPTRIITGEQNNLTQMFERANLGNLRKFLVRTLDPYADRIIVPANGLSRHLAQDHGIPESKLVVIPNPIALRRIKKAMHESAGHPWFEDEEPTPVVLNVGVLDEQKDQKTLLHAFATLRESMKARLVFLGDGPLRKSLQSQAEQLEVQEDVRFFGFQSNPFKFMSRASVFVLSSRYEGFGLVLAEALACGCPVISTRAPYGPEEILSHGETGLLSAVGDAESLASHMRRAIEDSALRKTLIENGRRRAEDFAENKIAKAYAEAIRNVISKNDLLGKAAPFLRDT